MEKKNKALLFALLAFLGLVINLLPTYPPFVKYLNEWGFLLMYFFSPFQLKFFNVDFFDEIYWCNIQNVNLIESVFLLLMLLSVMLYRYSNNREVRLLTFILCTIFLNQLACFFMNSLGAINLVGAEKLTFWDKMYSAFAILKPLMYMWFSYSLLKPIVAGFNPDVVSTFYDTFELKEFVFPSSSVRIFHHILDIFLLILMYSIYIFGWLKGPLKSIEASLDIRLALLMYFVVVSFLYYAISEWLFGATPAKMLTQTRVVNEEGNTPKPSAFWLRTLYRRIPFDAISFIGNSGWHDKFSGTQVVCLKSNGVKGGVYWWLLFVLFVLLLCLIIGSFLS